MKTFTKVSLSLAGILFVIGLTLNLLGVFMGGRPESNRYYEEHWRDLHWIGGWASYIGSDGVHLGGENGIHVDSSGVSIGGEKGIHVSHHSDSEGEKQTLESGELTGLTGIETDMSCADIKVQEGAYPAVSLSWNLDNYAMSYKIEDGILKVEDESWQKFGSSNINIDCKVLLTLPKEMQIEKLDLSTDMGDIEIDADITVKKVDLSTDMGDITSRGLQCKELNAESDMGEVILHMSGGRRDYNWDVETNMGELNIDGEIRNGGLGEISERGGSGDKSIEAYTSLGNIELYFD